MKREGILEETILLENAAMCLGISRRTGAIVRLASKRTGWEVIRDPRLGLSFRMMAPTPARRNTQILGERQAPPQVTLEERGLTLSWEKLVSEDGEELPIGVTAHVRMEERWAAFSMEIDNRSDYVVENVYYPYLGDVHRPQDALWMKAFAFGYAGGTEYDMWPRFTNHPGYYGVDYPTQFYEGTVHSPFVLLRSQDQGLYVGLHQKGFETVFWESELRPGYGESMECLVPETDTLGGKPVHTRFAAVQLPYILPGESRSLVPVAVSPYQGSWQAGCDLFRDWRKGWMPEAVAPRWAREPHAWQQIHVNSPEDELRMSFSQLPQIGRDCVQRGVGVIQLVGWNKGGQDQGNPCHDPDPRLGGFEELKKAIKEIQQMGVKVVLFVKFTWADRATEWFRRGLKRLAVKDPYGDYYLHGGYRYQTGTQLADVNTKRLIPMCFCQEYLDICCQEFQKVIDLGADGILFDEAFHHGPAQLCFATDHGHRPGAPVYAGDLELVRRFERMLPQEKKGEFLFAAETCYDREFEVYHLSYIRSESEGYLPSQRYLLPGAQIMTAVTGFHDRNMVNQCLLYRFIISYEPYNFKGRLEDYPDTLEYAGKMEALRRELADDLWYGEFCGERGAAVKKEDETPAEYSVFRNQKRGRLCVVAVNYGAEPIRVRVEGQEIRSFRLVEGNWQTYPGSAVLPPRSAAVFLPDSVDDEPCSP